MDNLTDARPPWHVLAETLGWEPRKKRAPTKMALSEGAECPWCVLPGVEWFDAIPPEHTSFHLFHGDQGGKVVCRLCAAALTGLKPVKWWHAHITRTGAEMAADGHDAPRALRQWLAEPVGPDRCVLVQTNRQKRSVLNAAWGAVATTDEGPLAWTGGDTARLDALERLRWEDGASEVELAGPALRSSTLAGGRGHATLADWGLVQRWDSRRLEIGLLATRRTEKKGKGVTDMDTNAVTAGGGNADG